MKVLVLGGGIVGVTTAYLLAEDGHEVTVIERNEAVARGTSFANAGLMAPGHAYAWSSPRAPGTMFRSLYRGDQAIRFKPKLDPRLWAWTWLFLKQCNAEAARVNSLRKHRLCVFSQQVFHEIKAATPLAFDGREGGYRRKPVGDGRADRLQIEVARNFAEIRGRSARRAVADLVRALVAGESTPPAAIVRTIADGTAHDAS